MSKKVYYFRLVPPSGTNFWSVSRTNQVCKCSCILFHFLLQTDASADGLDAVLCQFQDNKERVIAYASRSLSPSEKKYLAHKLGFLALKWAVTDKFYDYLYGHNFTRHRIRNSSPGGLRPSTLPLGHGGSPQY